MRIIAVYLVDAPLIFIPEAGKDYDRDGEHGEEERDKDKRQLPFQGQGNAFHQVAGLTALSSITEASLQNAAAASSGSISPFHTRRVKRERRRLSSA